MDENTVEVVNTETGETEVMNANQVLTLITTEDGIPTSTEVTVLTTALGDVPLMTASLGTLAEVPLVSTHPTFVTSHHGGVRTVYTTSINPPHVGQSVVVGDGQIAVLETDGVQQTIVVHTDPSQLSALAQTQVNEVQPQLISVSLQDVMPTSPAEAETSPITIIDGRTVETQQSEIEIKNQKQSISSLENVNDNISAHVINTDIPIPKADNSESDKINILPHTKNSDSTQISLDFSNTLNKETSAEVLNLNVDEKDIPVTSLDKPVLPLPEEIVCMVCYQAFLNPKCRKKELNGDERIEEGEKSQTVVDVDTAASERIFYGRTLGKFFEISRINMSIVTRRSYKDYEVPICQKCNTNLVEAEQMLEDLRRLERDLYYIRQRIKDEILTSHVFYKNKENKELSEGRRKIPGLVEILDIIDRIRDDIINDGRPPKIPRSIDSCSKKPGRKPKTQSKLNTNLEPSDTQATQASNALNTDKAKPDSSPFNNDVIENSAVAISSSSKEIESEKIPVEIADTDGGVKKIEPEEDNRKDVPAIRTSFGRLIKRPTYMLNELTDDDLSELGESSDDNYEEIEVKPELPPVAEAGIINDEEMDEEDPAWSPERGLFISERVGIPPSSSDESDNFSEEDSDAETIPKVKIRKEPKTKKPRKSKQIYKKRKVTKRVPVVKQEDVNYEVKVIQLDGTELMTINTTGADENIGLEPAITQKVMDSQAVIMVKNQLFGKRVQCPHCTRTFTDPHRRDIHVKKKHEGVTKPFDCNVCQKRFSRQDHLKNHMKRHMRPPKDKMFKAKPSTSEKSHSCEHCDQRFRNKSELAVHRRTHTGERPYKCDNCNEAFVSALKREFHIEQMHPEIPPIRCDFCPKGFFRQHRLRIHAVSHTGEKSNICELCGKSFSQAAMLRYHQTTHEELNLKQFKCQECNRVFANPQNLKSHMESQHQKMYRHRCPHCDRGYTQMSHLRRHLRTHSGEQPYICSYCPKRFTSGAALKIHVRIHTGERPYWCSLCEKGFRSKTKLGRHLKTLIHSGENKDRTKKETVTTEIEAVDVNAAATTTWTEIVGIITGV